MSALCYCLHRVEQHGAYRGLCLIQGCSCLAYGNATTDQVVDELHDDAVRQLLATTRPTRVEWAMDLVERALGHCAGRLVAAAETVAVVRQALQRHRANSPRPRP